MRRSPSIPRIAVDTWALGGFAANHGVQVYTQQLLKFFRELAPQYSVEISPYLREESQQNGFPSAPGFTPRHSALLAHSRLWRFGGAWARASLDRPDLVFNPHCTTFYAAGPVPAVTTIHDVIPVIMPWESRVVKTLRALLWCAARGSRAIITVSEHSKQDIVRTYGLPRERVHVVYNGCDHHVFNDDAPDLGHLRQLTRQLGIGGRYLIHHGALRPNKNLRRLILAYHRVLERNPGLELALVLAGAPDSGSAEVLATAARQEGGCGRVILTGPLDQSDLVALIKGASLAVFPSLYEGFCLPMIESMACGVPTIAAHSSCLPDVSGGVLRYFNPESVEEMSDSIEAGLLNENLRRELAARGCRRAAQFDWKRCAEQTLAVLADAAGARREERSALRAGPTTLCENHVAGPQQDAGVGCRG
jgi:glycosyltransferase involved in cell wall biosynthesis